MPTFVTSIVNEMSSSTVNFLEAVVTTYWGTILGVGLIFMLGAMFLRLGRFGRG